MFTTLYSVKVLYLTFLTNPNGPLINYEKAHEGDIFMSLPLMILAVFSIFFGYITKDMFIGLGSGFFSDNALFIHPSHEIMLDTEFGVPTLFKLLPLIFTISLSVIAIVLSEYLSTILIGFKSSRVGYNIFSFFNQRFLIELFYNRYITGTILKLGGQTTKVIDKGSVEYLGPYGLEKGLLNISNNIARLNTGVITSYALYILIGLIGYLLFSSYINSSNIILVLVISLSLALFQSKEKSITFKGDSLQSSSHLEETLTRLSLYSSKIPGIEGLAKEAQVDIDKKGSVNELNKIAEVVERKKEVVTHMKEEVMSMANSELQHPNITPDQVENINAIKDDAIAVAEKASEILQSGMEIAQNLFF
jgi:hypothetical protein